MAAWIMFTAFSVVAAIMFSTVNRFLTTKASAQTNATFTKFYGGYAGKTAVLAIAFFLVLLGSAAVLKLAGERVSIPEVL